MSTVTIAKGKTNALAFHLSLLNRHNLIVGATRTRKQLTLKVIAD